MTTTEGDPMTTTEQQDETPLPTFPKPLTDYCSERYGIRVGYIGEDGEMFALGHPDARVPDATPRRFVAAFAAEARLTVERLCESDPDLTRADVEEGMRERWAVVLLPCGVGEHSATWGRVEPACNACRAKGEQGDGEWLLDWGCGPTDPGAFPVTVLSL